jgi:rhodanese-related sulfurtransferase
MSTQAAETLVDFGFTNVMEVDGGMIAWQAAGFELVQNQ